MWYNIKHKITAIQVTPFRWRKPKYISLLQLFGSIFQRTTDLFNNVRVDTLYKLKHSAQVCHLRGALNDHFDRENRQILLADKYEREAVIIYTKAEEIEQVLYNKEESNETLVLWTKDETEGSSADFKVLVPRGLVYDELEMRALIDFYKLDGITYIIEEYIP